MNYRAEYPEFNCFDCGVNTLENREYYMLRDDVWFAIVDRPHGMLCVGCVEVRLGRELVCDDFAQVPLNTKIFNVSERLASRLDGFTLTV